MDLIHTNADSVFDYPSKDKCDITETDPQVFETVFKDVFKKFNPVNEEDEIEDIIVLENIYYIKNNRISNFLSTRDKSKDVKIQSICYNTKKEFFEPLQMDVKSQTISLDEEEEEESQSPSYQLDTIQTNSLLSNKPSSHTNDTKTEKSSSSSSTRTFEKKPNPFQVYNSREFNIFHPGGKVELYQKIKEEIQDIDKLSQPKPNIVCKFKIKKKNKNLHKKRKREKVLRKCKPDNIRKKIKSRFFKSVKNRINQILRNAKSKEFFDLLPQCFIINITKKKNQPIMKMTFKNLVTYNFIAEELKEEKNESDFIKKKRMVDIKKYNKNLKVMEYLNKNEDVVKKSKFDIIGNMTVSQMFNEYLKSDEFEKEVLKLEEEGDNISYIKDYILTCQQIFKMLKQVSKNFLILD